MRNSSKFYSAVVALSLWGAGTGLASAALIYSAQTDLSGQGFGTVNNILTMQQSGGAGDASTTEQGKVAWNGSQDVVTSTSGTADANVGKTATYTFGSLGITDASEIVLGWNPDEVGNGARTDVLTAIISIYAPDGTVVFTDSLAAPVTHLSETGGVGNAGHAYLLDAAGVAGLRTVLNPIQDFSLYRIGLESLVSFVDNGPDTWTIQKGPGDSPCTGDCGTVPSPAPLALLGIGLGAIAMIPRRRRSLL